MNRGRLLVKATFDPNSLGYKPVTDPKRTARFMGAPDAAEVKDEDIVASVTDLANQADFNAEESKNLADAAVAAKEDGANTLQQGTYVTFLCRVQDGTDTFVFNETGEVLLELQELQVDSLGTVEPSSIPSNES